jgi:hypothetical protein
MMGALLLKGVGQMARGGSGLRGGVRPARKRAAA